MALDLTKLADNLAALTIAVNSITKLLAEHRAQQEAVDSLAVSVAAETNTIINAVAPPAGAPPIGGRTSAAT